MDCVHHAAGAAAPTRTVLGGRTDGTDRPVVTIGFIAACVIMFALTYVMPVLFGRFALVPVLAGDQPWRLLTSAFLHAGLLHLALNMYALWIVGPFLEQMLGRWRFVALLALSALGGSVAVLLLTSPANYGGVTVGASGAVFGLFAAIAIVLRRTGRDARQILVVIGINVVLTFVLANISWQGHLGGLITGAILGALFAYLPKEHRTVGGIAGVIGMAAVLAVLTAIHFQ